MSRGRQRIARRLLVLLAGLALVAAATYGGIRLRLFRAPFPDFGKRIAWIIGEPEIGYNFDTVLDGRIYRSGEPDARFLEYLQQTRGLERLVSLNGPLPQHDVARDLGIDVTTFAWSVAEPPPREELEEVLAALDAEGSVLVHCAGGADRTGLAIATWRVRRLDWSVERALGEMASYAADPARSSVVEALRREAAADGDAG